jgi:hypothetical protein
MIAAHRFELSKISKDQGEKRKGGKITSERSESKGRSGDNQGVIPLKDLVPRKDPKGGRGGSGKAVFGGGPVIAGPDGQDRQAKKGRREK